MVTHYMMMKSLHLVIELNKNFVSINKIFSQNNLVNRDYKLTSSHDIIISRD